MARINTEIVRNLHGTGINLDTSIVELREQLHQFFYAL